VRTYYYSKGIQLYLAPTMEDDPKWQSTIMHIALEGRCHVLSACQYAQQKDFPLNHELPKGRVRNPEDVVFKGGSVIVSPLGNVLAGPLFGEEGVLTSEIDLDEQIMGKFDLDSVGHYARSDSECSCLHLSYLLLNLSLPVFQLKVADIPDRLCL
jgi:predicted amidohydrolase